MIEIQELQIEHYCGRAKNALQNHLIHKLLYPKVYFDADWDGGKLDVLAIDRAGSGDVHGVRLVLWEPGHTDDHGYSAYLEKVVAAAVTEFVGFRGHFRYIAVICTVPDKQQWIPSKGLKNQCLAPDGVGRLGMLYVDVSEEDADVKVLLKAERFRSSKEIVELSDRFVAEHTANWEYREEL
ncbi:MAG: hypothetical protein ABSG00_05305 [Terracidiphilus sp.]|jgi:hypothetical protein